MPEVRVVTLACLFAAIAAASTAAMANEEWHFTGGEAGYTFHPGHAKGSRSRADVMRELAQAKTDGSYNYLRFGVPAPSRNTGPGKTREAVIKELVSMSGKERARMSEIYFGP